MKKSLPKLVLRKETLRALSCMDLTRIVGGNGTDVARADDITFDKQCPAPAAAPGQ
jgi:hypothetical protein